MENKAHNILLINPWIHDFTAFDLWAKPLGLLYIGSTLQHFWYPGVFEVIETTKSIFPSVPVVLGGLYATLCHGHAVRNSGADYVIEGAGELEVLKLADNLSGNKRDYHNVREWVEDKIIPAYELYPELDSVSVITSRGCPYRCSYCASFLFESKFAFRRPEDVVAELERYVKGLGVEDIAFFDDALLVDHQRHIILLLLPWGWVWIMIHLMTLRLWQSV